MTQSTTETITFFLEKILNDVHPMMAEGIYLAAIPHWYDADVFAAIRNRDDGRNQGLIERLTRYSFIMRWDEEEDGRQIYAVRAEERLLIQRHWIAKDPAAYREAHRRALAYWEANPDPNPFAHAQNQLYHQLFVNRNAAVDYLVDRFRAYHNDRQLAAIERLLDTVDKARFYLTLLNETAVDLDDLVAHLRARLAQLRGDWAASRKQLETLRQKADLQAGLQPYVTRAYGHALAHTGDYVGAMAEYEAALTLFQEQTAVLTAVPTAVPTATTTDSATLAAEKAQTLIALGDAHIGLATSVHTVSSSQATQQVGMMNQFEAAIRPLRRLFAAILSLPLILYLSLYLGRRVWRPRFWPAVANLDWIIARLFAKGARYYRQADPILEQHGEPGEAVAADEKLAYLTLAMGDADGAQIQFENLLQETEAPLSEYRQAAVRVGLGQAWLRQEQPIRARAQLEQALPTLREFEDDHLEATALTALGEALYAVGEKEEAIAHFSRAANLHQSQGALTAATNTVERLEAFVATDAADESVLEMATAVSRKLPQRQYAAQFRHPLLIYFRRAALLLLPIILLLMPLFVIRLDSGVALTPSIQFKAAPIFNPSQTVSSQLSQGVTTANVVAATNADLIIWLAVVLVIAYIALSLGLGLLLIVFTPPRTVQRRGQAATVRLDESGIRLGDKHIYWADVTAFVKGDVRLWQRPLPDESAFALVSAQKRLIISGSANWYDSLRRRVAANLPDSAQTVDRDYTLLQSKLGRLYLANVLFINIIALLAWLAPAPLWLDIPGLPYSLGDLYPYFFLGLVGIPVWWAVVRPLQTDLHLDPHSRFPWIILGAGLLLTLFQAVTLFRPLLTAPNLYPPLVTLIMMAGAGSAVWLARDKGQPIYGTAIRGGTAVVAVAVGLLMALLLWREVGAYHYLVLGNARRDHAQLVEDAGQQETMLAEAIDAYSQAIKIGGTRILGIDVRTATRIPLGIPEPHNFTWLSALTNRAALQVQIGRYAEAMGSYTIILDYTNRPASVYAWRAIARQSWQATDTGEGEVEIVDDQYELALNDFDQAIELAPRRAVLYLWRGVAHHALNDWGLAWDDYETALGLTGNADTPLTEAQRERALTGQGWIKYQADDFDAAKILFKEATIANPSETEAWVGYGYASFSQGDFPMASLTWNQAFQLAPDDPTVLISLGTLHWKLGGQTTNEAASCDEYGQSADYFTQAAELPGQDPKSVAFTYRTRAQVQYLLRNCPDRSFVTVMNEAIASYGEAVKLDPENAAYWQLKGRLGYALWLSGEVADNETAVLYEALIAINEAYRLDPDDQVTVNFRNAILNALEPLVPADAAAKLAAGAYETALDEATLLAKIAPDNPAYALQAGLAALAADDTTQARKWYETGIAAAATAENGVELLTQALADLDALTTTTAVSGAEEIKSQLTTALADLEAQDPATLFGEGLAALQNRQTNDALDLYARGLTAAIQKMHLTAVTTAVVNLQALPTAQTRQVEPLFSEAFPQLALVGEEDAAVETAVALGLVAAALDDFDSAANWYNEAIRRTFEDNSQYGALRQSRNQLRELWANAGVNSTAILQAIQAQLPQQLSDYPGLADEGFYWRYRAWFKYGMGLSAFRLGGEPAAAAALQSAQDDADRAYQLDANRQAYAKTYLEEGAWGWFHIERGDDFYGDGDYAAALADYEAAAELIRPDENGDARAEATLAAFKTGLAYVQLEDFEEAADWYAEGAERAQRYAVPDQVAAARDALLAVQSARPELTDKIDTLLGILSE